jgi:hypothetical protein
MARRLPRNLESLVTEQVRRWELEQQQQKREPRQRPERWPLITVSREFGAQGAAVGRAVAEGLGFDFWDKELVEAIAAQSRIRLTFLESLDEHARHRIEDLVSYLLLNMHGTGRDYLRQLSRVVHTLNQHGAAVVVGRGAEFILESAGALRVRVVCPFEERARGYARRNGLDPKAAERVVRDAEEDRRRFIRMHYERDLGDPSDYDLVLNTGTLSVANAAQLVTAAYRLRYGPLPERHEPMPGWTRPTAPKQTHTA